VLIDHEAALVLQQAMEHMRRLVFGRRGNFDVEGTEPVGNMRIEFHAGILTVVQIGVATDFAAASSTIEVCIRG
jgi:hypothetical protein